MDVVGDWLEGNRFLNTIDLVDGVGDLGRDGGDGHNIVPDKLFAVDFSMVNVFGAVEHHERILFHLFLALWAVESVFWITHELNLDSNTILGRTGSC